MKSKLATLLMPVVRLYIRYVPLRFLKLFLWRHFAWREHRYVTRTAFGIRMAGRTNDLVQGHIYYFGVWEPNLSAFVQRRLSGQVGRTFVDVGANVGYFSLLAARTMIRGAVVSIEAFPSIHARLTENIELNGLTNVRAVSCAVTDRRRVIPMYHGDSDNEGATTSVEGKFVSYATEVEGVPLSEVLSEKEIETTRLMKIDVEGAEFSVLQGMRPILHRLPADAEVAMEINPAVLSEGELTEVFGAFAQAAFLPYIIQNPYDVEYYLFSRAISRPKRMREIPSQISDIIFSRVDAEYL